jgi:hypothetical protein
MLPGIGEFTEQVGFKRRVDVMRVAFGRQMPYPHRTYLSFNRRIGQW